MIYKGWTNYNTWLVNRQFFEDMSGNEFIADNVEGLSEELRLTVEAYIDENTSTNLTYSWAWEAVEDVNWREIAEGILDGSG